MNSRAAEEKELERAIELLGRSTRQGRLLEYVGRKYFQQQEAQLTEFNIATEVFGRSAKNFDAGQDAVVRVEAHRLRKRLLKIYEKGGATGSLQISIPAGTYVPRFSSAPFPHESNAAVDHAAREPDPAPQAPAAGLAQNTERARRTRRWWLYLPLAIFVTSAIVGAVIFNDSRRARDRSSPPHRVLSDSRVVAGSTGVTEVHLMAGYRGSDVIDNSGVRWTPDRFVTGGSPWASNGGFVRRTSKPFLFSNWRNGEFRYDIPVEPGIYELRLFLVTPMRVGHEQLFSFNVSLGGKPLLTSFDVNMDAQGADVADEKVFRDVAPDKDGFIRLQFSNEIEKPWLNALALVPGLPGKQLPVRIITQPTSFVDHQGRRWRADDYFLNGVYSSDHGAVSGTEDPELFTAERYGHFSYAIPVDTRGRYTVILHFAEFYFGPQLPGGGGVGSRIFHVFCNGRTLLENFDVFEEGGSRRLVTKTFKNIKPSAQGKINLTFEPVINNATVSGIEVLDESD